MRFEKAQTGKRQRGISLIELIMFIVIVSVALAGILLVMNTVTRHSADPLIHKQALAIAESLLEEVELMPFTTCDPDDPIPPPTDGSLWICTPGYTETIGPEAIGGVTEDRYGTSLPSVNAQFDNVNDYNGFNMAAGAIMDIANSNIGLGGYSASIAVTPVALGGITLASGDALQITVTVTGPDGTPVVVEGMRTRYAPNATP